MRQKIQRWVVFLCWGFMIYILNNTWGDHPALGRILNPFKGVWQNGVILKPKSLELPQLQSKVDIEWDENHVPHIFAENDHDLYFAQGYLHAQDRLFQMDLAARAGSGRLSELVGDKTLDLDKHFVKIGMREGAQKALEGFKKDELTNLAVNAYVEGINAYIQSLNYKDYPVEYKLLNVPPELFTPLHVAQFLKVMSFRLAGKSFDLELTRLLKKLGSEKLWDLFPPYPKSPSYIVKDEELKENLRGVNSNFSSPFVSVFADYDESLIQLYKPGNEEEGFNGSNNWAVHKSKTEKGYNLLANDTHLAFTLPSVWYEMQLVNPNSNVYGASFPGAPGVIIGHNQDIAWAVTNATMDPMDFYEVEFRNNFTEYLYEGEWKKVKVVNQQINVKHGLTLNISNLWTHQGVVIDRKDNKGLVMAWVSHQETTELKSFLKLNRDKDATECRQAIQWFQAPAQNFICADREKISITHNGKIPVRKVNQGSYVMTSDENTEWKTYVPFEELPYVENPSKGFVDSANQVAVSPNYKYYLGWYYDDSYRAHRITEVLSKNKKLNAQDMMELQNDILDKLAESVLPHMLKNLDKTLLGPEPLKVFSELVNWDYKIKYDSYLASVFYMWWKNLRNKIWQDQLWSGDHKLTPQDSRTSELIISSSLRNGKEDSPDSYWLDNIETPEKQENLKDVLTQSFIETWKELSERFGSVGEKWNWSQINKLNIRHVARIPGFEGREYKMNGSLKTVSANKGSHGASWKMVVELGPQLETWTNIPGGVSGNPFDPTYQIWLESWSLGKMRKSHFWQKPQMDNSLRRVEWRPVK